MKMSPLNVLLYYAGSVLLLLTVFAKPLGIPTELQTLPGLLGAICFGIVIWSKKRADAAQPPVRMTDAQRKKMFVFMVIVTALASATSLWVLPVTGVTLPFQTRVIISIVTFAVCATVMWVGLKAR